MSKPEWSPAALALFAEYRDRREPHRPLECQEWQYAQCWVRDGPPSITRRGPASHCAGWLVTDYEPGSQWRQRLLWPDDTSRKLLHQIQRAAGIDPDGPRLVPMQARLSREETRRAVRRASEAATRDRMLCRALRFT